MFTEAISVYRDSVLSLLCLLWLCLVYRNSSLFIIIITFTFIIIHLFNVDRSKNFTIKNIYIAVAIPLNDKDGVLIKVNEKEIQVKQTTMVRGIN